MHLLDFLVFPLGGINACWGNYGLQVMACHMHCYCPQIQACQLVRGLHAPLSCFWIIYRSQYFVFLLVCVSFAPCKSDIFEKKLQDINLLQLHSEFKMKKKNPTPLERGYGCFLHKKRNPIVLNLLVGAQSTPSILS